MKINELIKYTAIFALIIFLFLKYTSVITTLISVFTAVIILLLVSGCEKNNK